MCTKKCQTLKKHHIFYLYFSRKMHHIYSLYFSRKNAFHITCISQGKCITFILYISPGKKDLESLPKSFLKNFLGRKMLSECKILFIMVVYIWLIFEWNTITFSGWKFLFWMTQNDEKISFLILGSFNKGFCSWVRFSDTGRQPWQVIKHSSF